MVTPLILLWLSAHGGEPHPSALAAARLRDMLQRSHEERDGARLVARKLSVESALLPAFIVQDLAHGCASQDLAQSLAYTYSGTDAALHAAGAWPSTHPWSQAPHELGWACPPGMAWRVRATTERLCAAGPEPAVAIDWLIESDGETTTAIAERFEPALMPAELDFPLLPWGLTVQWDRAGGQVFDHTGRSHAESWVATAPILANPDDMFDAFDAIRVQQWLSPWRPARSRTRALGGPAVHTIDLDRGPLCWHDPTSYTLTHHGALQDGHELFRPVRSIPAIPGLRAEIEWAPWPEVHATGGASASAHDLPSIALKDPIAVSGANDPPARVPCRVRIVGEDREQAIITFGRFSLVHRGEAVNPMAPEPPWLAVRQAIEARDATTLTALVLRAQDGLGSVRARARMGLELAIQALDAAIEAGWTVESLRTVAPDLLERCMSRLTTAELAQLTLDCTLASRGTLAVLAASRLAEHSGAGAEERAWASLALPSLWAWLHEPPSDDSPLGARRLICDRALRPILLGDQRSLTTNAEGPP